MSVLALAAWAVLLLGLIWFGFGMYFTFRPPRTHLALDPAYTRFLEDLEEL